MERQCFQAVPIPMKTWAFFFSGLSILVLVHILLSLTESKAEFLLERRKGSRGRKDCFKKETVLSFKCPQPT